MKTIIDTNTLKSLGKKSHAQAIALSFVLALGIRANALPVINGGFESGDFGGWTLNAPLYPLYYDSACLELGVWGYAHEGTASVMQGAAAAAEGRFYAALFQNDVGGPGRETGVQRTISLSQDIFLREGQRVAGHASYANTDYSPADSGWVSILNDNGALLATPWLMHGGLNANYVASLGVGDPPAFGWVSWEWVAPVAGTYTLQLGVGSFDDGIFGSNAYFDGIAVSSVPDAGSTLALLLASVMGLRYVSMCRKKMRSA